MSTMASAGPVELIVQADDFGMCHAVNEAVTAAFVDGVVTQSSIMAACPWVDEALASAARQSIPLGLHQTLTCDWEYLRWGPITQGRSLVDPDGKFLSTVADAAASIDPAEAETELLSQAERVARAGLRLSYLDVHMGMVCPSAYQAVSDTLGLPFLYPGLATSLSFSSVRGLSDKPAGEKKAWLIDWLEHRSAGVHLLVTHPGLAGAELASLTPTGSPAYPWAEQYRASDLETLLDPEVRRTIERLGIRLVSVATAEGLGRT